MKLSSLLAVIVLATVLITGCTSTKKTTQIKTDESTQKLQDANAAFNIGEFQKAFTTYEEIIALKQSQNKRPDSTIYQNAGTAAWELKQTDKAIQYLELAKRYPVANDKTYSILAKAFLEKDNLSKEITNLDAYISKYPQGAEIEAVKKQLFFAYVKSENWESAYKLWPTIDANTQNDVKLLNGYYTVNEKLQYKDQLEKIAQQLLKLDANNIDALEFFAEKFYWLAENSYVKEMKAYQANKTDKQYQQLLAAYKIYFENYRIAKDYFLKLYQISPKSRYATFLGNIFTRYENKEKADYYYNLAKKK
jgi:outer membrane protein assembly factor BamD (BamD/ComL family)